METRDRIAFSWPTISSKEERAKDFQSGPVQADLFHLFQLAIFFESLGIFPAAALFFQYLDLKIPQVFVVFFIHLILNALLQVFFHRFAGKFFRNQVFYFIKGFFQILSGVQFR